VSRTLDQRPSEYLGIKTSGKTVDKVTAVTFPELDPKIPNLPFAPAKGIYRVQLKPEELKKLGPDHPQVMCVRAEDVIPQKAQTEILDAWDALRALPNVVWQDSGEDNRSSTPALHAGVWHLSQKNPFTTFDTRQTDPEARKAIERVLELIKLHIAPVIHRLIYYHSPNLLEKQKRYFP
jgi:hypothetical protein